MTRSCLNGECCVCEKDGETFLDIVFGIVVAYRNKEWRFIDTLIQL